MFRQIIRPEKKEDLVVHLPEKYLGKEVEVEATEVKKGRRKKGARKMKSRVQRIEEMFRHFDKHLVKTRNFKFDREEANAR